MGVTFQQLPVELVEQVFSWIHVNTVLKFHRLSRTFNIVLRSQSFAVSNLKRSYPEIYFFGGEHRGPWFWFDWPSTYQFAFAVMHLKELVDLPPKLHIHTITPEIPHAIGQLKALTSLTLSHMRLVGTIPNEICDLLSLESLDLDYNQLEGVIPEDIGKLTNLNRLCLSDNQLEGHIPRSIGNLVNLHYFNASRNKLSGCIPETIANLTLVAEIGLSDNRLRKPIPDGLKTLPRLKFLYLRGNLDEMYVEKKKG